MIDPYGGHAFKDYSTWATSNVNNFINVGLIPKQRLQVTSTKLHQISKKHTIQASHVNILPLIWWSQPIYSFANCFHWLDTIELMKCHPSLNLWTWKLFSKSNTHKITGTRKCTCSPIYNVGSILDLFINFTFNASNFVQFDPFQFFSHLDSSNRSNVLRKQTEDNISLIWNMIQPSTNRKK